MRASTYVRPAVLESRFYHVNFRPEHLRSISRNIDEHKYARNIVKTVGVLIGPKSFAPPRR